MPERVYLATREPPGWRDRFLAHCGEVSAAAGSAMSGGLLVVDGLTPWGSALILAELPAWLHLLLGIPLLVGGVAALVGLLTPMARMDLVWALERAGIYVYLAGWLSFLAVMLVRWPAYPLVPVMMSAIVVTGVLRLVALHLIERRVRGRIAEVQDSRCYPPVRPYGGG